MRLPRSVAARSGLTVLGWAIAVELVFGWSGGASIGPLPLPTGIPLGNLVEGAIGGLLYGMVALGVVLVHRANRIINFAQAALGATPALLGILLISQEHVPYVVGILASVVAAVVVGVLAERVVLAPYLRRSRLILTVATIGLGQLLALGELELPRAFGLGGAVIPAVHTPLDALQVTITGVRLNGNYLAVLVVGIASVLGLSAFFRYTRIGLAVRASAENSDRAKLLGIPVARVVTVVWVMATVLSALAAFLREPLVGSSIGADIDVSVLLYGLAAAVLAGLDDLPRAVVSGVGLGMLDRAAYYGTGNPDLSVALVLPVLLLALLVRRKSSSRALDTGQSSFKVASESARIPTVLRRLPEVVWGGRVLRLAGLALLVVGPQLVGTVQVQSLSSVVLIAMVAVSLVVLTGWAGQVSLGQFGVAGIGAAVAGGLATHAHADFFLTLIAAVVVGAAVSALIGLPALRLPGLLLGIVTLAFAATVQQVILSPKYFSWLVPGEDQSVERPVLFRRWDVSSDVGFYYVCAAGLVLSLACAWSLRRSRSGRVFIGQRDNVRASQSLGIAALGTRLAAFALAGGIAALAGALTAYQLGTVSSNSFTVDLSVLVFVSAVVGGITSPTGAVCGAAFYGLLRFDGMHLLGFLNDIGLHWLLDVIDRFGVAGGVLFVLGFFPGGIASAGQRLRDAYLRRVALARGLRVPSLLADGGSADSGDSGAGGRGPVDGISGSGVGAPAAAVHEDEPVDALLEVRDLRVAYDGVKVVFGVDLHVRRGEVLALLGTNGAGKSTVLKAIAGLVASSGQVMFDGRDIAGLDAPGRVGQGIVLVPGGKGVFPTLSVADHFRAARWLLGGAEIAAGVEARQSQVLRWFPRLSERWTSIAGDLSGGEQQQLAVGMAFLADPELLIIDELSLGLSPIVVEQLLNVVREINASGTSIVLVEQSLNVAMSVADRAYFLEKGEVRFAGPTAELLERDDVVRSVFLAGVGEKPSAPVRKRRTGTKATARAAALADTVSLEVASATSLSGASPSAGSPTQNGRALRVSELAVRFGGIRAVDGVSFSLARGEVLGLIGQNGAGKTTIFDLVSGFTTPSAGRVELLGNDVTTLAPDARARLGLGRSFQDARIFSSLTVAENIATAFERHLPFRDHLAAGLGLPDVRAVEREIAWSVADLVELLNLGDYRDKAVAELSTGSRRVVDLAMALAFGPSVLLLDEPSSGIAQRETEALVPLLRRVRDETGTALLVIEHDMPLVREVSDRLIALELGRVVAEGSPAQVLSDPHVLASYLGGDAATISRSGTPTLVAR